MNPPPAPTLEPNPNPSEAFSSAGALIGAEFGQIIPVSQGSTRGISLKWRIALFTAALLMLFSAILAGTNSFIVSNTLESLQKRLLQNDLEKIQGFLDGVDVGQSTTYLGERLLGTSKVALYHTDGRKFTGAALAVPPEVVRSAGFDVLFWQDSNGGHPIFASLQKTQVILSEAVQTPMVLVVAADATYIRDISRMVSSAIVIVTALLAVVALAGGYFVSSAALRPLVQVAQQATRLNEHNLEALRYTGPRDELGALTTTLNQMVQRLKLALESQKIFLAETSHELRTPLTAMQGYLRRAIREPNNQANLEDALRVTESMNRLVNDVLQLSRGEIVKEFVPHLVDLGELVENVAREFPGVRIEHSGNLELIGDPDRLAQLTRNLVANAVRHAGKPEGVMLEVVSRSAPIAPGAREIKTTLELHVRDNGPGIPEQVLPRLFEKFYRGPGGGSGLGLAIAAQIVRAHQGEIAAENNPEGGAHFVVRLPGLSEDADDLS